MVTHHGLGSPKHPVLRPRFCDFPCYRLKQANRTDAVPRRDAARNGRRIGDDDRTIPARLLRIALRRAPQYRRFTAEILIQRQVRGLRGGEGGIRTHGTVARTPHFECGAFDLSATSPRSAGERAEGPVWSGDARLAEPFGLAKPRRAARAHLCPGRLNLLIFSECSLPRPG